MKCAKATHRHKDESLIPEGVYCYTRRKVVMKNGSSISFTEQCPYWSVDESKPRQLNGYCSFLEEGGWDSEGVSLLWDQVKECGIKEEDDAEE